VSVANFHYEPGKVASEALHWIRSAIADKRVDRAKLDDGQIEAALKAYGLTVSSDPIENAFGVHMAAADAAEIIAAEFGQESQIVLTELGASRSTAAREYRETAKRLRAKVAQRGAGVSFANPEDYSPTFVSGVDEEPELEA
jgi:hypothetical protein